jgi:mxaJ protein
MSSRCLRVSFAALALIFTTIAQGAERELRVCADPDNLPYSHQDGSGFENRIAQIVAQELGAKLAYTWFPHRRAFLRNTLNAGVCDVTMGLPTGFELALTTTPYYRSSYVFAFRADALFPYRSFDDARLRTAKIGVQLIGDDMAATPAGHALAARGIVDNVSGFPVYGKKPQVQRMMEALARKDIDVALVWGPPAAYFARLQSVSVAIMPAASLAELADVPLQFSMAMAVRKSDGALRDELDRVIERRRADIDAVLREYDVPRTDIAPAGDAAAGR